MRFLHNTYPDYGDLSDPSIISSKIYGYAHKQLYHSQTHNIIGAPNIDKIHALHMIISCNMYYIFHSTVSVIHMNTYKVLCWSILGNDSTPITQQTLLAYTIAIYHLFKIDSTLSIVIRCYSLLRPCLGHHKYLRLYTWMLLCGHQMIAFVISLHNEH